MKDTSVNRFVALSWPASAFLALALVIVQPIYPQEDLSQLTNDELLNQIHRPDYDGEMTRRIERSPDGEKEALKAMRDTQRLNQRKLSDFTDDELMAQLRNLDPLQRALEELAMRYQDASPEEIYTLAQRLRIEYRTIPYPIYDTPVYKASSTAYNGFDAAVKALLTEDHALVLFKEVYVDSGEKGGITRFLTRLQGEPFTGPLTIAALEDLRKRVAALSQSTLNAAGENEMLVPMIDQQLQRMGKVSFEEFQTADWKSGSSGIATMGLYDRPEARKLLLDYYAALPRDYLQCEPRLDTLRALMKHWDREHNGEFRKLLRTDLSEILNLDHNGNPYMIGKSAEIVEETGDPWFLPLLGKRLANLDREAMRKASDLPDEYLDNTIEFVQRALNKAITTLEKEQVAGGR